MCTLYFNFKNKRKKASKHWPKEQGPGFQSLPRVSPLGLQPVCGPRMEKRAQFKVLPPQPQLPPGAYSSLLCEPQWDFRVLITTWF